MLPFHPEFRPGQSVYAEVIYSVKKAIVAGALRPGDVFPSVRVMSQELRINPNTAHKIIGALINEGLLIARTGIGTVVAPLRAATRDQRREVLEEDIERLVVEARRRRLEIDEVIKAVRQQWNRFPKE
ncbi:MAG: GntR family transcriptional regulator [Chthoniobacterales bacterium]